MHRLTIVATLLLIGCTTTSSLTPAQQAKAEDFGELMFETFVASIPDFGMTKQELIHRWGHPDVVQEKGGRTIWWYLNVSDLPMQVIFDGDRIYEIR